jgi:hypothetical protein
VGQADHLTDEVSTAAPNDASLRPTSDDACGLSDLVSNCLHIAFSRDEGGARSTGGAHRNADFRSRALHAELFGCASVDDPADQEEHNVENSRRLFS